MKSSGLKQKGELNLNDAKSVNIEDSTLPFIVYEEDARFLLLNSLIFQIMHISNT